MADIFLTDKDMATLKGLIATKLNISDYKTTFPASAIVEGVLPIERGGTGASTVADVLAKLGLSRFSQIATGNYDGGGSYGVSNSNVLNFPFQPKVVFMERNFGFFPWIYGTSKGFEQSNTELRWCELTWSGNTLRWYSEINDVIQGNVSGETYNWVAIG